MRLSESVRVRCKTSEIQPFPPISYPALAGFIGVGKGLSVPHRRRQTEEEDEVEDEQANDAQESQDEKAQPGKEIYFDDELFLKRL